MRHFPSAWLCGLVFIGTGALSAADVVVVEDGVMTVAGDVPPTAPLLSGEVHIGGGTILIGRTGEAGENEVVRGDDSRLTNDRTAAGGDADTVGGLAPVDLVQVSQKNQPNGVPGLDINGKIGVAQLPDEALGGGGNGSSLETQFETAFYGVLADVDVTYAITRGGMVLAIPGTFPAYPDLISMYGNSYSHWMASGPNYTFRNEPSNNESSFHFQCIIGAAVNDNNPKVDFGFHNGPSDLDDLPYNGAWFRRGSTNTTIIAYTGNNGTRTAHPTQFTVTAGPLYLCRIDFSLHTGARFRIWTDLSGSGAADYDQVITTNLPQAEVRYWSPRIRYAGTTSNTRKVYLAGMAHRVVRSSWTPGLFSW